MNKDFTIALIIILNSFLMGFLVGRATIQKKEIIEQKEGETAYGSLNPEFLTKPKEFKGDIKFLPYIFWKGDTVIVSEVEYINLIPDTAKIVEDFILKREYNFTVFDDKINGKLGVRQVVQYNRLQSFDYEFTPIITTKTVLQSKLFTPFVGASYNTLGFMTFGGGVFINNLGFEYGYMCDINSPYNININAYGVPSGGKGHSFGIKYKF